MAWCTPSPFPLAVLAEATRICPTRRGAPGHGISSDGICGDRAHQAEISDHNPDGRGIPHAVDISQSTPGAPYWQPGLGIFDAHAYGFLIAQRIAAGTERRVKYLVSFNGHVDIIFDPSVSLTWRQNGAPKQDHASHLHVSFLSGTAVENSTAPFFGSTTPAPPSAPTVLEEPEMILCPNKPDLPDGRVPHAILDPASKRVLLFNGAALAHDLPAAGRREFHIVSSAPLTGMCATRDPKSRQPDDKGVEVGALDGGTFKLFWS